MRKLNKKTGFTLAELLIVVAIIAILVAIGIPAFSTAMERSRETVDLSNIRGAYAEFIAGSLGGRADTGYYQVDIKQRDVKSWVVDAGGFLTNVLNDKLPTDKSGLLDATSGKELVWDTTNYANGNDELTTGAMWVKFTLVDPQDATKLAKVPTLSFVKLTTTNKKPDAPNRIKTSGATDSDNTLVEYYDETGATKVTNAGHWYLTKEQSPAPPATATTFATHAVVPS